MDNISLNTVAGRSPHLFPQTDFKVWCIEEGKKQNKLLLLKKISDIVLARIVNCDA